MNITVVASSNPARVGQVSNFGLSIGDRVRNLATGKLGTLERVTRDEWQGTMTYYVRTSSKVFALPAGKLVRA